MKKMEEHKKEDDDLLEIEDIKINAHLLNLLPKDKIAFDQKVQEKLKTFIQKTIVNKISETDYVLERIIDEITIPRLDEYFPDMYKNIDRITKRFVTLTWLKKYKESFDILLPNDYLQRLQNMYIKLGKAKIGALSQLVDTLDVPNSPKKKMFLDDTQKSIALYILALNLLKK